MPVDLLAEPQRPPRDLLADSGPPPAQPRDLLADLGPPPVNAGKLPDNFPITTGKVPLAPQLPAFVGTSSGPTPPVPLAQMKVTSTAPFDQSLGQDIKNAPAHAGGRFAQTVAGIANMANRAVGPAQDYIVGKGTTAEASAAIENFRQAGKETVAENPIANPVVGGVANAAPNLLAMTAGGMVAGPPGAAAVMGAATGGDVKNSVYDAAIAKGLSEEDAQHLSDIAGAGGVGVGAAAAPLFAGPGKALPGLPGIGQAFAGGVVGSAVQDPAVGALESAATGQPMPTLGEQARSALTAGGVNALIHGATHTLPDAVTSRYQTAPSPSDQRSQSPSSSRTEAAVSRPLEGAKPSPPALISDQTAPQAQRAGLPERTSGPSQSQLEQFQASPESTTTPPRDLLALPQPLDRVPQQYAPRDLLENLPTENQNQIRLKSANTNQIRTEDFNSGAARENTAPQPPVVEQGATPAAKPKPAPGPYTRAGLEKFLLDKHAEMGGGFTVADDKAMTESGTGSGQFTFYKELPGEVRTAMEGTPELKNLFQVTNDPSKAGGEDSMSQLGQSRYFEIAQKMTARKRQSVDEAVQFAKTQTHDPDLALRGAIHEAITNLDGPKPRADTMDPRKFETGTKFNVAGHEVEIVRDESMGGIRVLRDGDEFPVVPVEAIEKVPVDRGTLKEPAAVSGTVPAQQGAEHGTSGNVEGQRLLPSRTGSGRARPIEGLARAGNEVSGATRATENAGRGEKSRPVRATDQVTPLRFRGQQLAPAEARQAILDKFGIETEVTPQDQGVTRLSVRTFQSANTLRKAFTREGYQVLAGSKPNDITQFLLLRDTKQPIKSLPAPTAMKKDLYGREFIESSGVGAQAPMFHEPNPEQRAAPERVGSKEASNPKNTGKMFAEGPSAGTATSSEFQYGTENRPTGIRISVVDQERAQRGLPPIEGPMRRALGGVWDAAKAEIEAKPRTATDLLDKIAAKPKSLEDHEVAILTAHRVELKNALDGEAAALAQAQAAGDPEGIADHRVKAAALADQMDAFDTTVRRSKTATARGLSAMQLMVNDDFTLASMKAQKIAANEGKPLTPAQDAEVARLQERITQANATVAQHETAVKQLQEQLAESRKSRVVEPKAPPIPSHVRAVAERFVQHMERRADAAWVRLQKKLSTATLKAGIDPTILKDLAEIGAGHIARGTLNLADWTTSFIGQVGERWREHAAEIYAASKADYDSSGNKFAGDKAEAVKRHLAAPDAATVEARKQRSLQKQIAAIQQKIDTGNVEVKGRAPTADSQAVTELTRQRDALNRQLAISRRIVQIKQRIEAGDYGSAQRQLKTLDESGRQLSAQLERYKQTFQEGLIRDRLRQRSTIEKVQDTFVKWRRAFLLSSPITLAKLTSAAAQRFAITPIEEGVGSVIGKVFPRLAAGAPREGGLSIRAEARAITDGFTKGMTDAAQVLRSGKAEPDLLYGKKLGIPNSAIDLVGNIHGALKAPVKRAEFARSFQKRTEWNIRNGLDPHDPLVQTSTALAAYKDANRSIFQQDNLLSSKLSGLFSKVTDKATGKATPSSVAWHTVGKTLLPIVKVPTNIVAETMDYALGTVTGGAKLANAYRKGIEILRPEQSDAIMRSLKKGSLGAAVLALGYFNADKVGGYYQGKRNDKDVKVGFVRIFGVNIPSYLVHNPLAECLQIGATVRRVADSKLKKSDKEPQGIVAGAIAAALGVIEEVPLVRETTEIDKITDPHQRGQALSNLEADTFVPQAAQFTARQMDKPTPFSPFQDTRQRKPTGLKENFEASIPGLRQNVPLTKDQKKRDLRQHYAQP